MKKIEGKIPIGEMLIEKGLIIRAQLEECLAIQQIDTPEIIDSLIGQILVAKEYVDPEEVAKTYAEQIGMKYLCPDIEDIDMKFIRQPIELLYKRGFVPLYKEGNKLIVGTFVGDEIASNKGSSVLAIYEYTAIFLGFDKYETCIISENKFLEIMRETKTEEVMREVLKTHGLPYFTQRRRQIKDIEFEEMTRKAIESGKLRVHMFGLNKVVDGVHMDDTMTTVMANMYLQELTRAIKKGKRSEDQKPTIPLLER